MRIYMFEYPAKSNVTNGTTCILQPRPLSNESLFIQCINRYSHASKRFVEVSRLIPCPCFVFFFTLSAVTRMVCQITYDTCTRLINANCMRAFVLASK